MTCHSLYVTVPTPLLAVTRPSLPPVPRYCWPPGITWPTAADETAQKPVLAEHSGFRKESCGITPAGTKFGPGFGWRLLELRKLIKDSLLSELCTVYTNCTPSVH